MLRKIHRFLYIIIFVKKDIIEKVDESDPTMIITIIRVHDRWKKRITHAQFKKSSMLNKHVYLKSNPKIHGNVTKIDGSTIWIDGCKSTFPILCWETIN